MKQTSAKDLRDAVLQAALEGKLTSRNTLDSDVHERIKQIKEIQEELIKTKKIKPIKANDPLDDIPYDIPESWEWVRLKNLVQIISDGTHKTPNYVETGIPFLSVQNISSGKFDLSKSKYISKEEHKELVKRVKPKKDDILICRIGTLGKAIKNTLDIEFSIFVSLGLIRVIDKDLVDWIIYVINSPVGFNWIQENKVGGGTHTDKINLSDLGNIYIPIPPIEEQQRIVDKVDELMAKIDEYEKIEKQLVKLKKDFPKNMKDSILQAAMRGKLTKHLDSDSSAFELANEIKESRLLLGNNKYVTNSINEIDFPDCWAWIKTGECFGLIKGENVVGVSLPYLEAKYLRGKSNPTIMNSGEFVKKGTTVILVDGENSGEIFIEPEDGIIGSTFKVLYIPKSINKRFALYFLEMNKDLFRNNKKGAAIPHLNKAVFNDLVMPIPPIEEQQRIADLLDKVLPLCDQLEEVI